MQLLPGNLKGNNTITIGELVQAGIKWFETSGREGSNFSTIFGAMQFACGTVVVFRRNWYYWSVQSSAYLPRKPANILNSAMREDVRVEGYAGGKDVGKKGCAIWHVDTLAGMKALAGAFRKHFGEEIPPSIPLPTEYELEKKAYGWKDR